MEHELGEKTAFQENQTTNLAEEPPYKENHSYPHGRDLQSVKVQFLKAPTRGVVRDCPLLPQGLPRGWRGRRAGARGQGELSPQERRKTLICISGES